MIGYVAVLAAGYVLGTKAGRERYQQIVGTYRAVTSNPATKSMIDAGRRKIAERVSPDPGMTELEEIDIDRGMSVVRPQERSS
ncbi:MAG: hypothetical protein KDB50_08575 [Mycobacterium sp.]|nr:hypothetical protein [Mycobacterium sp.]